MKQTARRLIIAIVLCFSAGTLFAEENLPVLPVSAYTIGPGDILDISVWKNPDLTRQMVVLPDGKIVFPLIGELQAAGKTVAQLSEEIRTKIDRFVPDATLTLVIHQVGSMHVYVIGRVNNPGRFALNTSVNVLQALSMAGGLNPFAKSSQIKIFREQESDIKVFYFDYDEVAKGKDLSQNMRLKRGDVIVVP